MLEGEAGVGKTALWRQALDAAGERGWRRLISAPAGVEARLAFAALGDLLDLEIDAALPALPKPQRLALEVALLRQESDSAAAQIDERMIGVATLSALRALAAHDPLVVAIDDLQWVDASSASALRFALRRLRDQPVLILATRRIEARATGTLELERMLGDERVSRLRIGPLTLGGVHELLLAKLGFHVSRPTLVRLHELTGGNPFYSLEIGRELLARGGEPAPDEPLPVPGSVRELVHARLERLSAPTRSVLLAAAALARPTCTLLARLEDPVEAPLDEAVAAGVVELPAGDRVRQPRPLEEARTLLAYGALHRRQRRKFAARERLEQALTMFEQAGADQWAERTRAELGRIGGRRAAAPGTLSATETAIARQVAAGRTNREVAAALHLSARTVEWNLSKLYRKLGVRSRTELAHALAAEAGAGDVPGNPPGIPRDAGVKSAGFTG